MAVAVAAEEEGAVVAAHAIGIAVVFPFMLAGKLGGVGEIGGSEAGDRDEDPSGGWLRLAGDLCAEVGSVR